MCTFQYMNIAELCIHMSVAMHIHCSMPCQTSAGVFEGVVLKGQRKHGGQDGPHLETDKREEGPSEKGWAGEWPGPAVKLRCRTRVGRHAYVWICTYVAFVGEAGCRCEGPLCHTKIKTSRNTCKSRVYICVHVYLSIYLPIYIYIYI